MIDILKNMFLYIALSVMMFPVNISAADDIAIPNPIEAKSIMDLVKKVLEVVLQIGVPVAALFIVYSGFLFVKARGNPEELKTAKNTFMWVIVGTAILLGAWVLAQGLGATVNALR